MGNHIRNGRRTEGWRKMKKDSIVYDNTIITICARKNKRKMNSPDRKSPKKNDLVVTTHRNVMDFILLVDQVSSGTSIIIARDDIFQAVYYPCPQRGSMLLHQSFIDVAHLNHFSWYLWKRICDYRPSRGTGFQDSLQALSVRVYFQFIFKKADSIVERCSTFLNSFNLIDIYYIQIVI